MVSASNVKSQAVSQTIGLNAYSKADITFAFSSLSVVYGISSIYKEETNAFGKYQDLAQRNSSLINYVKAISENKVTIEICGQVDTYSEAKWTITAVGI